MDRLIYVNVSALEPEGLTVLEQLYPARITRLNATVWCLRADVDDELDGASLKDLLEEDFIGVTGVCELLHEQPHEPAVIAQALALTPPRYYEVETLYLKASTLDATFNRTLKTWFDGVLSQHLIHSALAFATHQMNVSQTAKALYLHRNSMHYRLSQIKDATGCDPYRFETLALLHRWYAL